MDGQGTAVTVIIICAVKCVFPGLGCVCIVIIRVKHIFVCVSVKPYLCPEVIGDLGITYEIPGRLFPISKSPEPRPVRIGARRQSPLAFHCVDPQGVLMSAGRNKTNLGSPALLIYV